MSDSLHTMRLPTFVGSSASLCSLEALIAMTAKIPPKMNSAIRIVEITKPFFFSICEQENPNTVLVCL